VSLFEEPYAGKPHGSVRGRGQLVYGCNIVAPPGNQAVNGENKPQPVASEEAGLLDSSTKPKDETGIIIQ